MAEMSEMHPQLVRSPGFRNAVDHREPLSVPLESLRHREIRSNFGLTIVCQHTSDLASSDWSSAGLTSEIIASDDTGRTREWKIPVNGNAQFFRITARAAD